MFFCLSGKPYTVGQQPVYPTQAQYGQTGTANAPPQFNPPAYSAPVYNAELVSAPQPYGIQVIQPGIPQPGYAQQPIQMPAAGQRIPYTTPIDDTIPLLGLGIFQTSLYLAWPWSCGCACTNTTLCCTNQQFTCVSTEPPNPMDSACICNHTDCQCCHPVRLSPMIFHVLSCSLFQSFFRFSDLLSYIYSPSCFIGQNFYKMAMSILFYGDALCIAW